MSWAKFKRSYPNPQAGWDALRMLGLVHGDGQWHQDPEQIERLCQYCLQDVEAEHALSEALGPLPPKELAIWQLDQEINRRGIRIDAPMAFRITGELDAWEATLIKEAKGIAGVSPKQVAASVAWIRAQGVAIDGLTKATVDAVLGRKDLPTRVRRFLEIRQSVGKSSTAKYKAMIARTSRDGRARGNLLYHGAATGRWAGAGIQPQNLPRPSFKDSDVCVESISIGGFKLVEALWGCPMDAAATCLRSMIVAEPGNDLVVADFSSIEARVNAHLARQDDVVQAFRDGLDLYKVAASGIFNVPYAAVDKMQRQVGKTSVLALGYQGGINAYASMAKNYRIDLESLPAHVIPSVEDESMLAKAGENAKAFLEKNPGAMSLEAATACDCIKQLWRKANRMIVRFWHSLEEAAQLAVRNPGKVYEYNGIKYKVADRFLLCRLPSGRTLHYCDPSFSTVITDWGQERLVVRYYAVDSTTNQWTRRALYGGLACENIVQAVSRDLMAEAMLRLELAGYPIVLTVHDEVVAEVPEGFGSVEEFERIMAEAPEWAGDCPLGAEGWRGLRYRK